MKYSFILYISMKRLHWSVEEVKVISNFRIDERLIHGQVIATWLKTLGVTHLIVASDEVADDKVRQTTLKMVLPDDLKCLIKGVNQVTEILMDERAKNMKIMLITGTPQDALRIVEKVPEIREVNLANYGSIMKSEVKNKRTISKMVYLDDDDVVCTNKLNEKLNCVYTQKTPSDLKKIINIIK